MLKSVKNLPSESSQNQVHQIFCLYFWADCHWVKGFLPNLYLQFLHAPRFFPSSRGTYNQNLTALKFFKNNYKFYLIFSKNNLFHNTFSRQLSIFFRHKKFFSNILFTLKINFNNNTQLFLSLFHSLFFLCLLDSSKMSGVLLKLHVKKGK